MKLLAAGAIVLIASMIPTAEVASQSPSVVLAGKAASLKIELKGGVLSDFHLTGDGVNPLQGMGHFLCLDRWGPPSASEAKNGMPFHGEASKVDWGVSRPAVRRNNGLELEMRARLPMAGLDVQRRVWISDTEPLVIVREEVTNRNPLGRIFNIVQHPTIGAPFLDRETRVDAGAGRGFMQSSPLPDPEKPMVRWPEARHEGKRVDLRRLTDDPNPNVVSYEALGKLGWTTACAPKQERLVGYVWPTADYPWFNAWRHVDRGEPALRGLEFGTTGLHQPFPVLVKKGRIFDLPLYTHLDAGEAATRSYAMFLQRTPSGFEGVKQVSHAGGRLTIAERGGQGRRLAIGAETLF